MTTSSANGVCPLRHVLGLPTEELLRGPVIKKELEEQLSRQTPYLHLVHWWVPSGWPRPGFVLTC